ncbi:MAG: DNA polymerase III subunit gamma/tau, partial [Nocardioidaceae bacterium]|nr:DNA polymerase III subunit gamma/tau [Nocardioidaceae bacterium]
IGTIRSRTHHYPFRLLPPRLLGDYLSKLCAQEGVTIEPQALPLVVRAGAGSARDSLSVLDQLMGGAGEDGITYELATALLGYTPETLIDSVVDAFAAGDGAGVFMLVDQVVEGGREPRRFVEDLLQRLRDLVVLAHAPNAAETLLDVPVDQAERLAGQAVRFGPADLVRAAEVVATTLVELKGPTAPRLLLEIMCARVLLPAAEDTTRGLQARLDRLERRITVGAAVEAAPPQPAQPAQPDRSSDGSVAPAAVRSEDPPAAEPEDQPEPTTGAAVGNELHQVRTLWPDVLDVLKSSSRYVWALVGKQAQVVAAEAGVVTLGFKASSNIDSMKERDREAVVVAALDKVLGGEWRVELVVDPSAGGSPAAPAEPMGGAQADDPDATPEGGTRELLSRELGATVIEEIPNQR